METFFLTVAVVILAGAGIIYWGPKGWRTVIFNALVTAVPGAAAILEQVGAVDWSKFFDQPKIAYGLAVGIPAVALWLRMLTRTPVGG